MTFLARQAGAKIIRLKSTARRAWSLAVVAAWLAPLLYSAPVQASYDAADFAYDQKPGSQVPLDVPLRDEEGKPTTLQQVLGQSPTILALGYFHCPNLCGLVRQDLIGALSHLDAAQTYTLVALSIDPTETNQDASSAKSTDIANFGQPGATAHWHYLTGPASSIEAVSLAVGFRSQFDTAAKQFLHPAGLVFLTTHGVVSSYLLGLGYKPGDVGLGITRASNGITARALPILLLCFHYDASTGRYTFAIMRVLQLGAALTVLVICGTLVLLFRRERGLR